GGAAAAGPDRALPELPAGRARRRRARGRAAATGVRRRGRRGPCRGRAGRPAFGRRPPGEPVRGPSLLPGRRGCAGEAGGGVLMAVKTLIEGVREALAEEMERDERVWVLGEDVGRKGGVFLATEGLYTKYGEGRVLDTPLAESCIVGVAIGSAINGLVPVAEIQFADFIHPAFDQIVSEAARMRYRSNGDWSCPITIRTPYVGGA